MSEELTFYATPGRMTDLGAHAGLISGVGGDIESVRQAVQGVLLHNAWAQAYGIEFPEERQGEVQKRSAEDMIVAITGLHAAPLNVARPPDQRMFGNCRHFSTLSAALLRAKGVPARARCGFGTYFEEKKFVDHWAVQWWNGERWQMTDAQLDDLQVQTLKPDFDPLDVPAGRFVDAGRAWKMYRDGEADGEQFGIFDMWGPWFIRGNVVRDVASLNKVEVLPWDGWGLLVEGQQGSPDDDAFVDRIASATARTAFDEVRSLYEGDDRLRVPDEIRAFWPEEHLVRL